MMPENRIGLAVLEDFLHDGVHDTTKNSQNIFDQVTTNVELARQRRRLSIAVEIPKFTIKSDISVVEHMSKVNGYFYFSASYYIGSLLMYKTLFSPYYNDTCSL